MTQPLIDTTKGDGLRAVCLPDLCHHAEYRIYVDGQYIESVGSNGSWAERSFAFYQRRRRTEAVEVRPTQCNLPNCERRQP